MNLKEKYKIRHLTAKQKIKCDRIASLIQSLSSEGVHTCVASTPNNVLIFYRANNWLGSMEEIQKVHNDDRGFTHECIVPIDTVGY